MKFKEGLYEYVPGFLIAAAVLASMVSGLGFISYIGIYYWALFRFDLVPVTLIGALGLLYDSYCSPFLGLETSLFSAFALIVYLERRILKDLNFNGLWLHFFILITLIFFGKVLLFKGLGLPFDKSSQGIAFVLTLALFPIYVRLVYPLYRRILTV